MFPAQVCKIHPEHLRQKNQGLNHCTGHGFSISGLLILWLRRFKVNLLWPNLAFGGKKFPLFFLIELQSKGEMKRLCLILSIISLLLAKRLVGIVMYFALQWIHFSDSLVRSQIIVSIFTIVFFHFPWQRSDLNYTTSVSHFVNCQERCQLSWS